MQTELLAQAFKALDNMEPKHVFNIFNEYLKNLLKEKRILNKKHIKKGVRLILKAIIYKYSHGVLMNANNPGAEYLFTEVVREIWEDSFIDYNLFERAESNLKKIKKQSDSEIFIKETIMVIIKRYPRSASIFIDAVEKSTKFSKLNYNYDTVFEGAAVLLKESNKNIFSENDDIKSSELEIMEHSVDEQLFASNIGAKNIPLKESAEDLESELMEQSVDEQHFAFDIELDNISFKESAIDYESDSKQGINNFVSNLNENNTTNIVHVYYATDRVSKLNTDEYYSGEWNDSLEYGIIKVNIPESHEKGKIERPLSFIFKTFKENPENHVCIIDPPLVYSENEFFDEIKEKLVFSSNNDALVFIHGFNVNFKDSILRTGQLAYDLDFRGPVICFSWPSDGSVLNYANDIRNNELSIIHISKLLLDLKKESGIENVHIIAHSMGNRAFTAALKYLRSISDIPILNQVILAAADIDSELFRTNIAPAINNIANRITLYASSKDKALMASDKIYGNYRRVGLVGSSGEISIVDGIDTVDISSVDGGWLSCLALNHSAYGDELIDDIYLILTHGHKPDDRNLRSSKKSNKSKFWKIKA